MESLVADALQIVFAIASVYLALGLLSAFLQGEYAAMSDRPGVKAEVMQKVGLLVVCVTVIAFADGVGIRAAYAFRDVGGSADAARSAVLELGQYVAVILIWMVVIVMAVGVVFGFVDTQLSAVLGQPVGLGRALQRVAAVVVLGIGGLLAMTMARIVVDVLRSLL